MGYTTARQAELLARLLCLSQFCYLDKFHWPAAELHWKDTRGRQREHLLDRHQHPSCFSIRHRLVQRLRNVQFCWVCWGVFCSKFPLTKTKGIKKCEPGWPRRVLDETIDQLGVNLWAIKSIVMSSASLQGQAGQMAHTTCKQSVVRASFVYVLVWSGPVPVLSSQIKANISIISKLVKTIIVQASFIIFWQGQNCQLLSVVRANMVYIMIFQGQGY